MKRSEDAIRPPPRERMAFSFGLFLLFEFLIDRKHQLCWWSNT